MKIVVPTGGLRTPSRELAIEDWDYLVQMLPTYLTRDFILAWAPEIIAALRREARQDRNP